MIQQNGYLQMNGSAIMEFALREVKDVVDSVLVGHEITITNLSAVVLHQANLFMLQYLRKKLGIGKEILPIAVNQYGNTGSASIPITLCSHYSGQAHRLHHAVLAGFGVGLSWGAVLLNLSSTRFTKVLDL